MSAWGTSELASALPQVMQSIESDPAPRPAPGQTDGGKADPQKHGWVDKTSYDYASFNKSSKELLDDRAAAAEAGVLQPTEDDGGHMMGVKQGDWASTGAVYEFPEGDFGDVGPALPALEKMLFGDGEQMTTGVNFKL